MIFFDEQQKLFHLKTKNTSYIFAVVNDAFFLHLYWGKRINTPITGPEAFMTFSKRTTRSMSALDMKGLSYSSDVLPQEFPTFGNTDMRSPALHAVYPNGSRITALRYVSHEIFNGKKPLPGMPATYVENDDEAQTLEVTLKDALTGMQVVLSYSVFEELDVITRSARVMNGGNDKIRLRRLLSASVDFRRKDFDFIHLPGAWARERHPQRNPIFCGTQLVDSARGASSCQHNPFFALAEHGATETHGDVYGFNLVYSGNFTAGVELDPYDTARAFIGINPFDFEHILEAGDTFHSPEAVLVYSDKGLGGMSRIYHKLYRTRLCRGKFRDIERYVLINTWEATYMNFNADKIVAIAEKAASVGVELMVLDDGWFGNRYDDHRALGDWVVNTDKLQGTLANLADRINALGMKFGLWFEPEMVSVDSDCYRAHPDWCIHVPDRERTETRQQLMLDLSRDDVCDFIIDSVSNVLKSANIEYVKWDYNRNMTNIGSALLD
ncbi:MAG: alpha-galactosidase, partial [Clostridia bacterium]|nr:alpha-galactosidase [Clostridia bacterium]